MFIFWSFISLRMLIVPVTLFFTFSLEDVILFWIFLELRVWGRFYFFLGGEEEEKSKNSLRFFVIQGLCTLIWMGILFGGRETTLRAFLIPPIIFLKIGMIPGHPWVWKIYERGNLQMIWIISSVQKVLPLGMIFFSLQCGIITHLTFKILILFNLILVTYFFSLEMNFFIFLLSSRILHYNNIIILLMNEKILETSFYFLSYTFTLFIALTCIANHEKTLTSPEGGEPFWGGTQWMLVGLSVVGFPPSLIFLVKIIFLIGSGRLMSSTFILLYVFFFLSYLLVLINSFLSFVNFNFPLGGSKIWNYWEKANVFKIVLITLLVSTIFFFFISIISLLVLEFKIKKKFFGAYEWAQRKNPQLRMVNF